MKMARHISLLLALVTIAVSMGCSSEPSPALDEPGGGAISMDLKLGRTTQIHTLNYTISGPNGFTAQGSLNVARTSEILATVPDVPAGGPYTLSLSADSTDGNVTCTGSKSGITVTCRGNRPSDQIVVRLTCTRNHLGREWGDRDWRSNAKTFFLGAAIRFSCGADAGVPDAASDGAVDASADRDAAVDASVDRSDGCVPLTACPPPAQCGTMPDGCGGTLFCGSCCAGHTCNANNSCGCVPLTCPAWQTCGIASDGCCGFITCGFCSSGQTCGTDGTCHTPATGCGIQSTTLACLQRQDPIGGNTCSQCMVDNGCLDPSLGSGTCEDLAGTQAHLSTPLPDGRSCSTVFQTTSETETQICLQALDTIFTSRCGQTQSLVPCICGTTDPTACLNGQITPNGPLFDLHICDTNSAHLITPFPPPGLTVYGVQQAETIANCAAAFGCDCLGSCTPGTACPAGQNCGTAPNGCGGLIDCGTCTAPDTCGGGGVSGRCGHCQPLTSCPAGRNCGTMPDGCGGLVNCGTCTAPETCGGSGIDGQCGVCQPVTSCPAGACGSIPDGCGGTVVCGGTCTAGQLCGAVDHTCHDISSACSPTGSTSLCLATRDKPGHPSCTQCAADSGCLDPAQLGIPCEGVPGSQTHFSGSLPDGRSCTAATSAGPAVLTSSSETETQICLQTLGGIFASQCAADGNETPCLCGVTEAIACLNGTVVPTGALYDTMVCDLNSTNMNRIVNDFTSPAFGIGVANTIVQCLSALGCDCF